MDLPSRLFAGLFCGKDLEYRRGKIASNLQYLETLSAGFLLLLGVYYHYTNTSRASMKNDFMFLRPCWGKSPNCRNVAVKVVSLFWSCLAGHLGDWPPGIGGAEPELLVEQGLEVVAKLPSLLFWVLLIPALVLQFFQYYICLLRIFFFMDICAANETPGSILV